jgi:hypothetical protein
MVVHCNSATNHVTDPAMRRRQSFAVLASLILLLACPRFGRAIDVLNNAPSDSLGFVLVRNLGATAGKVQQLTRNLQTDAVSPLEFLHGAMGIREGLNASGDFLLAVLPRQEGVERPQFCVWLPIADYERFVVALGGSSAQRITAVTIAGEDLLTAQQGEWALVMDPNQRERMDNMLDAAPAAPEQASMWKSWIDDHDVTAVALRAGVRDVLSWAIAADSIEAADEAPPEVSEDDLFGPPTDDGAVPRRPSRDESQATILASIQLSLRQWFSRSPKALEWAHDTRAIGLALRLDEEGNAHASIRAAMGENADFVQVTNREAVSGGMLPALDQGGEFIVSAAGSLPPAVISAAAGGYVRTLIGGLQNEEQLTLDETTLARFEQEVHKAAALVKSVSILSKPGDQQEGVYTNSFLAVRVTSTDSFVDAAGEVMRLWNQINRDAEGGLQLIFDVEEPTVGARTAKHYSLDIAAADGAPALPEIRQAMEKLFGPGGKLNLFIVPVDEHTALMAMATAEQVAAMLRTLELKQANNWDRELLGITNRMLPQEADWRVFFNPHSYSKWLSRKMHAITGPVFGGPLVKEFAASPPIGAAGGVKAAELWADVAVPVQTIQAVGAFRQPKSVQLQR